MTAHETSISAIALITLRQRHAGEALTRSDIEKAVLDSVAMLQIELSAQILARIVQDLETKLVIQIGRPTRLVDKENHIDWYFGERIRERRFFDRYKSFLAGELGWAEAAINAIDVSTDMVMEQLEDPRREGPWDRRGLVVGHVQSGKTGNYAGLANKAADAGYKLIIVLAGMHNALRQQTQKRMDRDVLGYNTASNPACGFTPLGVGTFDGSLRANHLTTQAANGDFNRRFADNLGMGVEERPVFMVVKKNASILENLNNWVRDVLTHKGDTESRPLLVIDDEADQASVDTGDQEFDDNAVPDPDYEPKRINGQIRRLLNAFSRSAYVAYTATPFANVLIHDGADADGFGRDLFPRNFIVNLPTPSNYIGPAVLFGIDGDDSDPEIDVIRDIDQTTEGWIAPNHKSNFTPLYQGEDTIPPSLEEAILSFILACAARQARAQLRVHNSMLIHVSRFKDVHQKVFAQVDRWLTGVKRVLRYKDKASGITARLRQLWEQDFLPASAEIRQTDIGAGLAETSWSSISGALSEAADRIKVQVVNSEMKESLDYETAPEGMSIIAIGGDKLSRGLTLEGLTVSYFLRASRMYDSLMQMGRWFGYRPGYVDLCRIYTTPDLELWFRHVATAVEELRDRLDHMAMIGATPEQYGLRIQSHDILLVTAQNKMRHSREYQVSFQGEAKIQTVFFREDGPNRQNAARVTAFLERAGEPQERSGGSGGDYRTAGGRRVWKNVPGQEIASLLEGLEFPVEARDVNAERLSAYVSEQLRGGELTSWTVAVLGGEGDPLTVDGWKYDTIERKPLPRGEATGRYVVKTILSPRDEAIDLTDDQRQRALNQTNRKRIAAGKPPADKPDGAQIRQVRGENPQRALLLIYPLSPAKAELDLKVPVFGAVVSFPDSQSGRKVRYRFNTIDQLERI